MRDYPNDTIAVELVVRHTRDTAVVEHRHELSIGDGLTAQPEWRNRRIVAVIDDAVAKVLNDFGVTPEQLARGRERDFITAPDEKRGPGARMIG